jgi:aerobic-type carbon monoxide dehydrogenase small subunit (CoxS/CutS family)
MAELKLNVNGRVRQVQAAQDEPLLWVLRNKLGLTGTKYGCGEGQCGACTVLIDGAPARSCQTRASAMAGHRITTIEGLEENGRLHPLQQAFLDVEAMQCGYCTAGMILSGVALLNKNLNPDESTIMQAMQGNVCRCGTYPRIVAAVRLAAKVKA